LQLDDGDDEFPREIEATQVRLEVRALGIDELEN
jgi:hypothetical protein